MKKVKPKMKRQLLCFICFTLCLLLVFLFICRILIIKRDDGVTPMRDFYIQPKETVDVLILGSSHAGMHITVDSLWAEYGISAYNLWGSVQPFWNTYYMLKEAFQYQKPDVVVLDVLASTFDFEYSDQARQIANTLGMRISKNKWNAISVTAPAQNRLDLMLGYPVYHNRLFETTKNDYENLLFPADEVNKHSTVILSSSMPEVAYVNPNETPAPFVTEKEFEYFQLIVDFCKNLQVPLVLIKTPYPGAGYHQGIYNTIRDFAQENDLPFLNFNLMYSELEIDPELCWMGDGGHLNYDAAKKVTSYLGEFLKTNYALDDHRGDETYSSWDKYYKKMRELELIQRQNVQQYWEAFCATNDFLFMSWSNLSDAEISSTNQALQQFGSHSEIVINKKYGYAIFDPQTAKWKIEQNMEPFVKELELEGKLSLSIDTNINRMIANGQTIMKREPFGMVVYDIASKRDIDVFGFNSDGTQIIH